MINYCLPIINEDINLIDNLIVNNKDNYQYFEIWIDYIQNFDFEWLNEIILRYPGRILVLFRRLNLEPVKMKISDRFSYLTKLGELPCYTDLDYKTQTEELEFIKKNNIKLNLILSYHNYQFTPQANELREIISEMQHHKAEICKIATFCQLRRDALRLLELRLELDREGIDSIILGMGEHGVITRLFGTIWGNKMIFAPLDVKNQTAPNQLNKKDLEVIFDKLGKFYGW